MIKMIKHPCEYKKKITHTIVDTTGNSESYTDTYYFCTMIARRLKKRDCVRCKRDYWKRTNLNIKP